MGRRVRKKMQAVKSIWLMSFTDLVTLLMTFFVLLLSMSSIDSAVLSRISAQMRGLSPIGLNGPGRIPERIELIVKALKDPKNVLLKQKRFKDLLFPVDSLPPEISSGDLEENLRILEHPEGVVIVLTEGLLFAPGSAALEEKGKRLLDVLTPVIFRVNADTNISGHSGYPSEDGTDGYELSFRRAAVVLEHFLQAKIPPDRFSVSGYGPDKPMAPDTGVAGQEQNRRVEILLKTTPRVGRYI